jgi:ATP-binding cassette subfamily F protein uup
VKLGTNVKIATFDQNREILNSESTLWESLTNSSETEIIGKGDYVSVRGKPRHVVGYLKDFLFKENQFRSPVSSLSGGEKARLILAKIMAKDSNLLVLDEPTNDLDLETLDLLQELIADYEGTILLVSHDRDFIDRIATSTIAIGKGNAIIYAGGWSDYLLQNKGLEKKQTAVSGEAKLSNKGKKIKFKSEKNINTVTKGLTFTQQHRLKSLPDEIQGVETEIKKLTELLSDMGLFEKDREKFLKLSAGLVERQRNLVILEDEWIVLEEKNREV